MKNKSKKTVENINNSNEKLLLSDVIKSVCKHKYYWREPKVKQCKLCGEILYNQTVL